MASMPAANCTVSSDNGQTTCGLFMTAISIMRGLKTFFTLHFDVKLSKRFTICLFAAAMACNTVAAPKDVEKTACGLLIRFGEAQVELAAVSTNALRLSVSLNGARQASHSTFLDGTGASTPVAWRTVKRHGMVGIKTIAGELLMNPGDGQWTLEDANGKTLIPQHAINDSKTFIGNSSVNVVLGWEKDKPIRAYGCGNGSAMLPQTQAESGVSNGKAVIPYYWSDSGYAVLAVTANDNQPASWKASTNNHTLTWTFPGAAADLYLMPAASPKDAARAYANLTGHAPVPPRWSFGYLQSRWGWENRAYIEDTLKHFEDLKLPTDAFIYDFEWFTTRPDYRVPPEGVADYSDFGWNTNLFPEPASQIQDYKSQGVHFVGIRKPRLGNADSLVMIRSNSWALRGEGSDNFQKRDLDFSNPALRDWYADQSTGLLSAGVDGWWNDEGEGSFTTYFYWNLAEAQAMARHYSNHRLWTLNRAFSPGTQRFGAAAWTGDIFASWEVLAETPASLLNWSLSGMPYSACDIGGFSGKPSAELLSRWMEAGVFFPIMRTHSVFNEKPHFPWLYGADALDAMRKAINLRYRLIPFYYSLAHETFETGLPIIRPLVMEFPDDPEVASMSDEWMVGDSLLAAPILQSGNKRSLYLPAGGWYAFESNIPLKGNQSIEATAGLDEMPVYVREGTILTLGPIIQHTSQLPGGPLQLQIYPGKDANFTLVEDDGVTTDYMKGQIRRTAFTWHDATGKLTWRSKGNYAGKDIFQSMQVIVFNPREKIQAECLLNSGGSLRLTSKPRTADTSSPGRQTRLQRDVPPNAGGQHIPTPFALRNR